MISLVILCLSIINGFIVCSSEVESTANPAGETVAGPLMEPVAGGRGMTVLIMYLNTTIELSYVIGASISTQSATAANIVTGGMDETEKCKLFRNFHLKKAKGKLTRSI